MNDGGGGAPDSSVGTTDARVNVPDADPDAPDASMSDPDANTSMADASVSQPDATVAPPDATVVPPDATVVAPDAIISVPDAAPAPDAACGCDDGADCTTDLCNDPLGLSCSYIDTCGDGLTCNVGANRCEGTLVFRQGSNGYSGTQDTFLQKADPNEVNGANAQIQWDSDDPQNSGNAKPGLLRFDGIVGPAADQLPAGATVLSATIGLTMLNGSNGPEAAQLHELLVDWSEATATYANFGGDPGINAGEYDPTPVTSVPALACTPFCPKRLQVVVTSSVQAWVSELRNNFGWVFVGYSNDGTDVASSETSFSTRRPTLTVEYAVAP